MKLDEKAAERLQSGPKTTAQAKSEEALRRFEESVESGESSGDVGGPPPGPWPVRKVKDREPKR